MGISDSVHFIPETPEIANYVNASDVLVVASREESAPLVSLEAFAAGIPLVSTRVFGLAEQVRDGVNALAFSIEEEGSMAACLQRLYQEPGLATELSSRAREILKAEFSLEAFLREHLREIEVLLAK